MTNSQWPGQPPGQSPWASQTPDWQPPSYQGVAGRDPHRPFGQPTQPAPGGTGQDLKPPPNSIVKPMLIGLAIVALIAALLAGLQFLGGSTTPSTSSPKPSISQSDFPTTAAATDTKVAFDGSGKGVFEILSQQWSDTGLEVRIKVSMNPGERASSFIFYAFTAASMRVVDPTDSSIIRATADKPYIGTVKFVMERGEATIVLATTASRAMAALKVKG